MTPGTDYFAPPTSASPAQDGPVSRWDALRSTLALALAAGTPAREHGWINLHAVLNLLNRLNGAGDTATREELISRLADYLTALHRLQSGTEVTLGGLCETARAYAAMRYFMADAIEPRIVHTGRDLALRSLESAGMAGFVQQSMDSLLDEYVPRVDISVVPRSRSRIELGLTIERTADAGARPPPGWTAHAGGSRITRTARFVARVRPLPRA
jgi:hypothetical protein